VRHLLLQTLTPPLVSLGYNLAEGCGPWGSRPGLCLGVWDPQLSKCRNMMLWGGSCPWSLPRSSSTVSATQAPKQQRLTLPISSTSSVSTPKSRLGLLWYCPVGSQPLECSLPPLLLFRSPLFSVSWECGHCALCASHSQTLVLRNVCGEYTGASWEEEADLVTGLSRPRNWPSLYL
jgi:hypothetical protein